MPTSDELDDLGAAGATWVVVSRWVDELPELIELAGDRRAGDGRRSTMRGLAAAHRRASRRVSDEVASSA